MKTKTIKTKCIDGTELLVDVMLEMTPGVKEAAIFAVRRNKASNMTEALTISTLELPDNYNGIPITKMRYCSFSDTVGRDFTPIQNLIIPDSIKSIDDETFSHTSIYNVRWSSNCERIPMSAFSYSDVRSLSNTENVKIVSREAFIDCMDLESINSETMNNCITIGSSAFENDIKLTKFTWPSKCKSIPPYCFSGCVKLTSLINISHIYEIGLNALANTGFKKFVLGENCKYLGCGCFINCLSLEEFVFNDICQSIPDYCFTNCLNLTKITNINHISIICQNAFSKCSSLTTFVWPKSCDTIPECCFKKSGLKNIIIPQMKINILNDAFKDTKIKEIDLSQSIIGRIDKSSFSQDINIKYPYYM